MPTPNPYCKVCGRKIRTHRVHLDIFQDEDTGQVLYDYVCESCAPEYFQALYDDGLLVHEADVIIWPPLPLV